MTEILRHTPLWVWGLLVALLALGTWQARTRRVARPQLLMLPLALLGLGLWSMAPSFGALPLAAAIWAAALAAGGRLGYRLPRRPGTHWHAESARLQLPGSWMPLAVIVVLFTLRYSATVAQVLHPAWRGAPEVALPLAAFYGAVSGLLLGRALGLLQFTRRTAAAPAVQGPARAV